MKLSGLIVSAEEGINFASLWRCVGGSDSGGGNTAFVIDHGAYEVVRF